MTPRVQNLVTDIGAGNTFIGVTSSFLRIDASVGNVIIYLPTFLAISQWVTKTGAYKDFANLYRFQITGNNRVTFITQDGSTIEDSTSTSYAPKGRFGTLTLLSGNRWIAEVR